MNRFAIAAISLLIVALAIAGSPLLITAQWPASRDPAVPRTSAGQPDLTAPAPRTRDGHPDLSGIWDNGRNTNIPQRGGQGGDLNAAPGRGARRVTAAPDSGIPNGTI